MHRSVPICVALLTLSALCSAQPPATPVPPTPPATAAPAPPPAADYYRILDRLPTTQDGMTMFQGNLAQILQDAFAAAPDWTENHIGVSRIHYTSYGLSIDSNGLMRIKLQSILHVDGAPDHDGQVYDQWIEVRPTRITQIVLEPIMMPHYVECSREAYIVVLQGGGRLTPFTLKTRQFRIGNDLARSEAAANARVRLHEEAVESIGLVLPCDDQQANAIGRAFQEIVAAVGGHATFTPVPPYLNVPFQYQ